MYGNICIKDLNECMTKIQIELVPDDQIKTLGRFNKLFKTRNNHLSQIKFPTQIYPIVDVRFLIK